MNRQIVVLVGLVAVSVVVLFVAVTASGDDDADAGATPASTVAPAAPTAPGSTEDPAAPEGPDPTTPPAAVAPTPSGFPAELELVTSRWTTDWTKRTIELDELRVGILAPDPRDAIRPLDSPKYESVEEAAWLEDRELGILFEYEGSARFYPLAILTSHEVVNDEINGFPYVVTYCPLCNTAVAFPREFKGEVLRFGVSGLLRNSDLVMWDNLTTSLWQQTTGEGIVGDFAGEQLEFLPTALVRWEDFRSSHPDGEVLSRDTGSNFDYGRNGYVGYSSASAPYGRFFDDEIDERFRALERVVGVRSGGENKAYPYSVLAVERTVNDTVGGEAVTVWWGAEDTSDPLDAGRTAEGAAIGTGVAFIPIVDGQVLTFTATGDAEFTDAETGSTWNILGEAIDGPLAGSKLSLAVHQNEFWFAWSAFNSDSPVHGG
jgi:hypothetical protein